ALLIELSSAVRKDARPGNGEAIGLRADVLQQRDIFLVTVIVVDGDIAGVAVSDLSGRVGVSVPDGLTLAVLVPRPLNLVSRRSDTPEKSFRKCARTGPLSHCFRARKGCLGECR